MKKITATLGLTHNEFEHQLKDVINEMSEAIESILSSLKIKERGCVACDKKATYMTTNLLNNVETAYCDTCLGK